MIRFLKKTTLLGASALIGILISNVSHAADNIDLPKVMT